MPTPSSSTGFTVDMTPLLSTGLQLNKFDRGIPLWRAIDGIQFTPSGIKRKPGRQHLIDLGSEPIRGLTAVAEFDTKVVYAGDLSSLYSYRLDTNAKQTVGSGYTLVNQSGFTVWDSNSTTWDGGLTVWDEGVVVANQWSFTNFGVFILAANGQDRIQIKKTNTNFNDLYVGEVSGAVVNAPGSGYALGDTLTHLGGTGTGLTTTITGVLGGAVTAFEITAFGSGYTDGDTNTQNTTSGFGTGFTLTVSTPDVTFTTATVLEKLGPHILAFNYKKGTDEYPVSFAWCSEDDVDTWSPSSINSAGDLTIREASSSITCVRQLGNGLGVYTESELFMVNFVGAPFYFGYRPVMSSGVGAVSINSVVVVDRKNYGLSRSGLFITDGSSVQIIGEDEGINEFLIDNSAELEQVAGYHDPVNKEITWAVPISSTSPNTELYYSYRNNTFGKRTSKVSAFQEAGVFINPVSGDTRGKMYFENGASSAQTTSGTTRAHDLGEPDLVKELTSIRVGKRGSGTPKIEVGWAEDINGAPTYVDSFLVNKTFASVPLRTAGRYLFLRVTSNSPSDTWEISHMIVQGRTSGTR